ncbi:MAG: hypothetical protein QXQ66_08050 [Candidatus Hadarchaeum sp.]|uniref:hypothetical protein n=1 Tax=Candidatus Hadarchaeum sp. TaxID=2883567 RepID=UPI0031819EE1
MGYVRYESPETFALLRAVYAAWWLFLNFFQPVRKLLSNEQVGSKVRKKYDWAQTLYQRVLASPEASEESKTRLRKVYAPLNPEELQRRIQRNVEQPLSRLHG